MRVVRKETEGMAIGVEHHPHVGLRLVISHGGALVHSPPDTGLEVSNANIEVHHLELFALDARPHGPSIVRVPLHLDLHVA
jgi:hypothetical protein